MKTIIALFLLILSTSMVEARQRQVASGRAVECNVTMPCDFSYDAPRRAAAHRERTQRVVVRQAKLAPHHVVQTPGKHRLAPAATPSTPEPAYTLSRPGRYIAGRLICAVNVGAALAERGIKGTGSALAMSYLKWGRSAGGPVPGAVIVSPRRGGGHVAIVSRVVNGVVYAWNATGGQSGWREIPYRHHVIDYRVPG